MTYEEAIKNINALNAVCCKKDFYDTEFENALALAFEALEKQIPKKPTRTNGGLSIAKKDFYTKCQLCNHNIPGVVRDARMRFCPFCGQKIDWSDDE